MYHVLTETPNGIRGLMIYPTKEAFESTPVPDHYRVLIADIGYEAGVDLLIKTPPRTRIERAIDAIRAGEDPIMALNKVALACGYEDQIGEMVDELRRMLTDKRPRLSWYLVRLLKRFTSDWTDWLAES